jgi:hypothetical protein
MTVLIAMAALVARAEDACESPMSRIQLGAAVGEVTDSLAISELIEARETLNEIHRRLPCLEEVVDRKLLALFARYNAVVYSYGQEEDLARGWALASRMADPDLKWDERSFAESDPVRVMIDGAIVPEPTRMQGKMLAPPRGGGVFVNGQFAAFPEAPSGTQILVQVFDRSGARVEAFWQVGAAFPATVVLSGDEAQKPPSWWQGDAPVSSTTPMPAPVAVRPPKPVRPPSDFPVVPVAGAGVLAAIAGGTYAFAWQTKQKLPDATPGDVAGIRTTANTLVLVSSVSLAGAVGVGVGGVLVSANGFTVEF